MSTEAQALANRRNAQKSTGPRTEEGKRRAGRNALKHGFTAQQATMDPIEQELFLDFADGITQDLGPRNPLELALVDQIIGCAWRLRRVLRLETDELRSHYAVDGTSLGERFFAKGAHRAIFNLSTHETRIHRSLDRAFKQLLALRQNPGLLAPPKEDLPEVGWAQGGPEDASDSQPAVADPNPEHALQNLLAQSSKVHELIQGLVQVVEDRNEAEKQLRELEAAPADTRSADRIRLLKQQLWAKNRQLSHHRDSAVELRKEFFCKTNPISIPGGEGEGLAHMLDKAIREVDGMIGEIDKRPAERDIQRPSLQLLEMNGERAKPKAKESSKVHTVGPEPAKSGRDLKPAAPPQPHKPKPAEPKPTPTEVRQAEIEALPEDERRALARLRVYQRQLYRAKDLKGFEHHKEAQYCTKWIHLVENEERFSLDGVPAHLKEFDARYDLDSPGP
jgi:hypothetical protein